MIFTVRIKKSGGACWFRIKMPSLDEANRVCAYWKGKGRRAYVQADSADARPF